MYQDNGTALTEDDRQIMAARAVSPEIIGKCVAHSIAGGIELLWSDGSQSAQVTRIADRLRTPGGQKYAWPAGMTTFPAMIRETGSPKLLIVEGTMQHLAAASWAPDGLDVWGMWGCDGIHGKVALPSLAGRDVWLCLDADSATNPRVNGAASRVAGHLRAAGAQSLHLVSVPPVSGDKTGLDDYLAQLPEASRTAALAALISLAGSPPSLLARMKNGAYLNTSVFAPLHYHVPGLVPEGLTVLTGAPKIGKSWLVLKWLLDLARAGRVVLYLALEDSDRRMQWRCRELLGAEPVPAAFSYLTEEDVMAGALLPTVAQFVGENHDRKPLVVVDTLAKAQQQAPRIKDEAQYERDYRVTGALQATVRSCPGAGLILCHHDRKTGGEDWVDKISGTKGLTGGPDAIMLLERKRGEEAGALHVTGRDIAESDYAMVFRDRHRWELDGGTLEMAAGAYLARQAQAGLGDRSAGIVAFVAAAGDAGVRRDDVAAEFGLAPETASLYLNRLATSGRIARPARGLYTCVSSVSTNHPYPYIDTEDTHTHGGGQEPAPPAPPPVAPSGEYDEWLSQRYGNGRA